MQESSSQLKPQEGLILVLDQVSGVLCVCSAMCRGMTWKKCFHTHMHKLVVILCKVGLTDDESHFTALVVEAAGHHGGHSVVDHGQHLHIHALQRQLRSDKPCGQCLKLALVSSE